MVGSCDRCNQGASKDEAYVACLIECVCVGSVDPTVVERPKIRRLLSESPALASRLAAARHVSVTGTAFAVEEDRVRSVLLKLARGHALFDLHDPRYDEPLHVTFGAMETLSHDRLKKFETPPSGGGLFPEVGSRSFERLFRGQTEMLASSGWIVVQRGRYRYLASPGPNLVVRMILSEFIACEVVWSDDFE